MEYILSIDIGTSSVKGALFDSGGREIALSVCEYDLEKRGFDIVELDPEIYWSSTKEVIENIRAASLGCFENISAVGVTSQGETLISLDRDGLPVRKAIVWLDGRARDEADEIASVFGADELRRVTGQQEASACCTACIILWLRKNEPENFARTAKFLLVEDYIIYKLSGRFASDFALYPSTLCINISSGKWWDEMLNFIGVSETLFPELHISGSPIGHIATPELGLNSECRVCVAPIDQIAGAVGAGNIAPGMITETTGTAMAVCASVDKFICDSKHGASLFRHAIKDVYALLPWAPASGIILRWFRDEFCKDMNYSDMDKAAAGILPGSEGLIVLPHFNGVVCPASLPEARGVFWGLSLSHKREHFIRAIMEAVAFLLKDYLQILENIGIDGEEVFSIGGASRSEVWMQIKADVLDKKIYAMECEETTCLGAAILAAVGCGLYDNLNEAVKHMTKTRKCFVPNPENVKKYKIVYNKYLKINETLKTIY